MLKFVLKKHRKVSNQHPYHISSRKELLSKPSPPPQPAPNQECCQAQNKIYTYRTQLIQTWLTWIIRIFDFWTKFSTIDTILKIHLQKPSKKFKSKEWLTIFGFVKLKYFKIEWLNWKELSKHFNWTSLSSNIFHAL